MKQHALTKLHKMLLTNFYLLAKWMENAFKIWIIDKPRNN